MSRSLTRLLAAGIAAAATLLGPTAVGVAQAAPPSCDGVWVVVQPDEAKPDAVQAKCATDFTNGVVALRSAGFTAEQAGGMLTRINGLPTDADFTSNGGFYWSYWSATVAADGTLGSWEYYQVAPDQATPAKGTAEGWLLTNKTDATGPALTALPAQVGDATAAPTASVTPTPTAAPAEAADSTASTLTAIAIVIGVVVIGLGFWWQKGRQR